MTKVTSAYKITRLDNYYFYQSILWVTCNNYPLQNLSLVITGKELKRPVRDHLHKNQDYEWFHG